MKCSRGVALVLLGLASAVAGPLAALQVTEVQVSPQTVSLTAGQQQGMFATAYDGRGNVVATATFTWRSSDPNVARVEPDNSAPGVAMVIAVAPGSVTIEARVGNNAVGRATVQVGGAGGVAVAAGSGTATVLRVEPSNILLLPSEQRPLIPVFLRDDGEPAAPLRVTWESLNPSIVNVGTDGSVIAISEGQAAVRVTAANGLTAIAPVSVSIAAFAFDRDVLSLSPGQEQALVPKVPSQGDRILPSSGLSWRSSNPAVATVSQIGLVRAIGAGSAQIIAQGFLQEITTEVRVHRPVRTMELSPGPSAGPVMVPFSGAVTFVAQSLADDGTPVPDAPIQWRVDDTTVARFDGATLQLHGLKLGSTRLLIRGPGPGVLEASWDVEVVAGGLATTPARIGLGIGGTQQVVAHFTDSTGRAISPATGHTWTSTAENVAQVSASGVVTAVGRGHAMLVAATSWGAADTAHAYVQGELIFAANRGGSINLWAVDRGTPGNATQVTSDAGTEVAPAFSPDGAQIAFVSTRDGNPEIYVSNVDGSEPRRLTNAPGVEDGPVWSSDGERIYFVAVEPGGRAQVHVMNADGTGRRALTQAADGTNFQPAVSPDGSTIAFTSTRDGNYEIYLMDADGGNVRNVSQSPGKESVPQWFSDDQLGFLVETRVGATMQSVVTRRQLSSSQQAPLSPPGLIITDFAISRDGQMLALQVERFGQDGSITRRLFIMSMSVGGPLEIPVAAADEQQTGPAWR